MTLLGTADSKRNASAVDRRVFLRVLGPVVPDKENQERVVRDSGLEWVLVRGPRFVNRGRARPRVIGSGENGRVGPCVASASCWRRDRRSRTSGLCAPGNSRRRLT